MKRILVLFMVVINIFGTSCNPHIEYPLLKNTTYITENNNFYFYWNDDDGFKGKLKTSKGEIYDIVILNLGKRFNIAALRELGELTTIYYYAAAKFEKEKVIVRISKRKIDIDPSLPKTITFHKYDGEVVPDWAKEEIIV